jgi:hypothetical protein
LSTYLPVFHIKTESSSLSIPKRKAFILEQTKVQRLFFSFSFSPRTQTDKIHCRERTRREREREEGARVVVGRGGGRHPTRSGQEKDKIHRFEHYQFSQYSPSQDEVAAYMAVSWMPNSLLVFL